MRTGETPYVDFHTGYTPLFYWLSAAWSYLFGPTSSSLRLLQTALLSASAAMMYALARPLAGRWFAALAVIAWFAFLPVFQGEFASFNVAYPAWMATAAYLGCFTALAAYARASRTQTLVVAGLLAAAAFGIKLNAGAFALAGAVWVAVVFSKTDTALDRAAAFTAAVLMLVGVSAAFGFAWRGANGLVHLLPCVVVTVAVLRLHGRYAISDAPRASFALSALAAAFTVPTLLWSAGLVVQLGVGGFARDVLLLGSGAADLYFVDYPDPGKAGVAMVVAFVGVAVVGSALRRLDLRVSLLRVLALVGLTASAAACAVFAARGEVALATGAAMPEGLMRAVGGALEESLAALVPFVHWAGFLVFARMAADVRGPAESDAQVRRMAVLVVAALTMFLQAFPRSDFMHLMIAAPASMVLGACILVRALEPWRELRGVGTFDGRALVAVSVMLAALGVVALKTAPTFVHALATGSAYSEQIDTPTVRAGVEQAGADDLIAFGKTARYVRAHTEPEQKVLAFPALTGILFAAGRTSPVYHDYWYPGRPSHEEETAMVQELRADPPTLVVALNQGWTFFAGSPQYFLTARSYVTENYRLTARFGRYDILAPRKRAATMTRAQWQPPPGEGDGLFAAVPAYRRQAARRWFAGISAAQCQSASLEQDPRLALLRLRSIHDGGDARALGWMLEGLERPQSRVREQALRALAETTRGFNAARFRWADDFNRRAYAGCAKPWLRKLRRYAASRPGDGDPRVREFAATLVRTLFAETAPDKP